LTTVHVPSGGKVFIAATAFAFLAHALFEDPAAGREAAM
jgi:hypothetical protein